MIGYKCIFLMLCVVVLMQCVDSKPLCKKFKKLGFRDKDACLNVMKGVVANRMPHNVDRRGLIKKSVAKVKDKITDIATEVAFAGIKIGNRLKKKKNRMFKLLSLNLSPEHKVRLKEEPGFNLTPDQIAKFKIWKKGIIPYFIDEFSFDKVVRDRIRAILDEVSAAANLQFIELPRPPYDDQTRYVFFINRRAILPCVDYTTDDFTNEGIQKVILGYDCIDLKTGMAAMLLTLLGVPPQHNAPNRDEHIEVVEENIIPDKMKYFKILDKSDWLFNDLKYDFESAGHYPYHKYTMSGGSTIKPKYYITEKRPVGDSRSFSQTDLLKILKLYNHISKGHNEQLQSSCKKLFQPGRDNHGLKKHKHHHNKLAHANHGPKKHKNHHNKLAQDVSVTVNNMTYIKDHEDRSSSTSSSSSSSSSSASGEQSSISFDENGEIKNPLVQEKKKEHKKQHKKHNKKHNKKRLSVNVVNEQNNSALNKMTVQNIDEDRLAPNEADVPMNDARKEDFGDEDRQPAKIFKLNFQDGIIPKTDKKKRDDALTLEALKKQELKTLLQAADFETEEDK